MHGLSATRSVFGGLLLLSIAGAVGCSRQPSPSEGLHVMKNEPDPSETRYYNPADGKTYVAEGGWETYFPDEPRPPSAVGQKVWLEEILLLEDQNVMAANTSVTELAAFCKQAEALVVQIISNAANPGELLVQFTCQPGSHHVEIAYKVELERVLLQQLHSSLAKLEPLSVAKNSIEFQLRFAVAP